MQLVLNTRGSFLKKSKNCFLVKTDEKSFEVSADKVDSILITTSATITTDAVKFAVENNRRPTSTKTRIETLFRLAWSQKSMVFI